MLTVETHPFRIAFPAVNSFADFDLSGSRVCRPPISFTARQGSIEAYCIMQWTQMQSPQD